MRAVTTPGLVVAMALGGCGTSAPVVAPAPHAPPQPGVIEGHVTGAPREFFGAGGGGRLAGVTISAMAPGALRASSAAVTDDVGVYHLTGLRPGTYVVTFEHGAHSMQISDIVVDGRAPRTLDIDFDLGESQTPSCDTVADDQVGACFP